MADVTHKVAIPGSSAGSHTQVSPLALALGSIGVVYGDIGTSPLYAFHVAVQAAVGNGPITRDIV
ncbi:MAG: KUP/HAK/KT family potassium transporter, partial [Xanthobacteraceae bacterium]